MTTQPTKWYVDLKEHIESKIDSTEKAIHERFAALKEAQAAQFAAQEKAIETRFAAQKEAQAAQFASQEKAVQTALQANKERFESTNEWRKTVEDIIKTSTTLAEFRSFKDSIASDNKKRDGEIESLKLSRAELEGKASQSQVSIAMIIGVIGIIMGVINIVIRLVGG